MESNKSSIIIIIKYQVLYVSCQYIRLKRNITIDFSLLSVMWFDTETIGLVPLKEGTAVKAKKAKVH